MIRSMRRPSGFTVLELLVAIGIIVVLSAILLPVLAAARNNARKVECISHLHNIGRAMGLYISDHYGYFPPWCSTHPDPNAAPTPKNAPDPAIRTWDMCMSDYLEKWEEVMRCPNNPLPQAVMGPGSSRELARAYALARQTQRPRGVNFYGGYKALIPNPSETVMIFEKGANLPGSWGDALGENVYQSHNSKGQPGYSELPFHSGGKNILYVDGNVKWHVADTGPFAWDPKGDGSRKGACELWGVAPTGDWPPLR
ncbi:MAG: type II secretion system protein [candidate division WS1 bacterium]|nr:type II secretion system protein [candidate division WS1 bacterium]